MITVKFVGGTKKSFQTDKLELEYDGDSINQLLEKIRELKPRGTPELDTNNILIAINGADSSSLDGRNTILKNNDVVTLIPVIHGGTNYIHFKFHSKNIRVYEIKGNKETGVSFLDKLRKKHPNLKLQAISKKFVLNSSHLQKIIELSLEYEKNNLLLSNKLETDILMRFSLKEQISDAIKIAGIKPNQNFFLIAIGSMEFIKKLHKDVMGKNNNITFNSSTSIKKQFKISQKQINSIYSETPLEDLITEKSSILFRNTSF